MFYVMIVGSFESFTEPQHVSTLLPGPPSCRKDNSLMPHGVSSPDRITRKNIYPEKNKNQVSKRLTNLYWSIHD